VNLFAIVIDSRPPRLLPIVMAGLVGGLLGIAAAPPAAAQPRGQATAPTDSLGRAIFGFLRPTYATTYNISDQESAWTQDFDFENTFGRFNLSSNTGYTIRTSPNRVDFQATSGSTINSLRYNLFDRVPLNASLNYNRDGTDDTNDKTRREAVDAGVDASYRWRIRKGFDLNSTAGLALTRRRDSASFQGVETGARESGLDRTLGATLSYLNVIPGMSFTLNGKRVVAEARSRQIGADAATRDEEPQTNRRTEYAATWNFIPTEAFDVSARWDRRTLLDNFILVSRDTTLNGRQETQETTNEVLGLTINFKPPKSNTTSASLSLSSTDVINGRAVERERSSDRSSHSMDLKGRHRLQGVQVDAKALLQLDEDRSPIRPSSETVSRTLEVGLSDSLGKTVDGRLLGEAGIRSQSYEDMILDQDIQKLRAESSLGWRPSSRLNSTISSRFIRTNTVNIDSTQSASSRNEDNIGATLDLRLALTPRTTITQNYDFRVLLTTFRFNPPGDDIQRTRTIRTTVSHELVLQKLRLDLTHDYKYTETGRYGRRPTGVRFFAATNDRYDQDLRLAFSYTPTNWLTFRTDEWLHRDDNIRLADQTRTTTSRIEFNQSVSFNRPIPGGGTITCTASYKSRQLLKPRAGAVEDFVNVSLALTKPF
jgi:hypothetical protein